MQISGRRHLLPSASRLDACGRTARIGWRVSRVVRLPIATGQSAGLRQLLGAPGLVPDRAILASAT